MILAELQIAAENFPAARKALGDLTKLAPTEGGPTARMMTIMAAIERGEGEDDAVVRGWLAKALSAPRGPQWICDKCNAVNVEWAPVCAVCSSFDTLSWKESPINDAAATSGEMLPLIVGTPDPETDPEEPFDGTITVDVPDDDEGRSS